METNPEPKKPILFFFFFEPLLLPLKKKKSTSSCKPHNSLSLPAPKTQEQNQTQNPKQIPKSILVIWWRRGSSFAAHSGIDFLDLFTCDFFFSCFSLFLVQSGLAFFFFFLLVFPRSLLNLGNYLCLHLGNEGTFYLQNQTHLQKTLSSFFSVFSKCVIFFLQSINRVY